MFQPNIYLNTLFTTQNIALGANMYICTYTVVDRPM